MFRIFHVHDAECIRVLVLGEHGKTNDMVLLSLDDFIKLEKRQ